MKKKINVVEDDDPLDREIDFSKLEPHPNTHARDFGRSRNVRILDPSLLEIFPDSRSMNEALRTLVRITNAQPQKVSARRAAAPKSKKRKAS